jgi:AraC-like DNA-binding protein
MRNSDSIGDALRVLVRFQLLNSRVGSTYVTVDGQWATLGWTLYQAGVVARDQIYSAALAVGVSLMRELLGEPHWSPAAVSLAHAAPLDPGSYRRAFHVPIRFDADQTGIHFPTHWLTCRVAASKPALRSVLEARAAASAGADIVSQARRAVRILLLRGCSSGDEAAAMLSMHRRTLNRRLLAAQTSFQRLLDDVRFETARELLEDTNLALIEISAALGYEDASAFSRSFRRWAGIAPSAWRSARGGGGPGPVTPVLGRHAAGRNGR